MLRLVCFSILLVPGLLLLALALSADFGPLETSKGGLSRPQIVLLVISGLALAFGALVHGKATKELAAVGRPYLKTVLFLTLPTALLTVAALCMAEITAGVLPQSPSPGLIFPPRSTATTHTCEFRCTVKTNSLGIRDAEIGPRDPQRLRIIAIGDSFTYGWGVDAEQSWPKVLQRRLCRSGRRVEILNLGGPGASPMDYAVIARRAIGQLKPDLVLVAVLQGDDLAQLICQGGKRKRPLVQTVAETLLPNLGRRLDRLYVARPLKVEAGQMRKTWQLQVRAVLDGGLTDRQKGWWRRLDPRVKELLLAGEINPGQLQTALKHPDWFLLTLDPDRADVRQAVRAMAGHFKAIREEAEAVGAKVVVLSVPHGAYVSRRSLENHRRLGFTTDDAMLESDAPDAVIRAACRSAGVEFFSVTGRFRGDCEQHTLYYEFDGHFNPEGQALFAGALEGARLAGGTTANKRPAHPRSSSPRASTSARPAYR